MLNSTGILKLLRSSAQGKTQIASATVKVNNSVAVQHNHNVHSFDIHQSAAHFKWILTNDWLSYIIAFFAIVPSLLLAWNTTVGTYCTFVCFMALLAIALRYEKYCKLAISFALLPLTLIIVAVSPYNANQFYHLLIEYDFLLTLSLVYWFMFNKKRAYIYKLNQMHANNYRLNKKQQVRLIPPMAIIGVVLGAIGFSIYRHQYDFTGSKLFLVLPMVVIFSIVEEQFFRGLIQRQASKIVNPLIAAALSMLAFTAMTSAGGGELVTAFAILSGFVLSTTYYFKHNLLLTTTINAFMKMTYVCLMAALALR